MLCKDIIECLESLSPREYAEDWDNVGLLVGRRDKEVNSLLLALDVTENVVDYAVKNGIDMIVTHHPMIFKSMGRIDDSSVLGRKVLALIENHISYYAMHTNFDIVGSMGNIAAEKIGIVNVKPLDVTGELEGDDVGIGVVGDISEDAGINIRDLSNLVKDRFNLTNVMVYGDLEGKVSRVAMCPGSGKSVIGDAIKNKADVLITGDIGHHEGMDAAEAGLNIIDATHYGMEHIFVEFMSGYLSDVFKSKSENVDIIKYEDTCPYTIL